MYQHILVCTDLTASCQQALQKAAELAKSTSATLSILHVIEPVQAYGYPGVVEIEANLVEQAKHELQGFCKTYGIPESKQNIVIGPTKREILKTASQQGVDLIVTGSHGRHGMELLLGSTANAVLHGAECDVLTIRIQE